MEEERRGAQSLQLWSMCNLQEDEEPLEASLEETQYLMPEREMQACVSLLQWTTLRPTNLGSLNSAPRFHSTQISQMAFSSPSMSIKSQISKCSLSHSPAPPVPGHSQLRLILPGNQPEWNHDSSPSLLRNSSPEASPRKRSGGSSGFLRRMISSTSSSKGMDRTSSRGSSSSRSP
ncbi:movement protein [Mume associated luteovirus]|nr:movement protein [Mume associated luteovirus]